MPVGQGKGGGHDAPFGPRPDKAGVAAPAERQAQGIKEDRLAGAGLAGQHRQPPLGRDVELLDKDDVADGKSGQHGARLIARLKGQTRGPAAYRGLSFEKTFEIQDCSLATGACPSVDTSA